MTTIKSYTDLSQSKKLAEILPIESADMYFEKGIGDNYKASFGNYADMQIAENMLGIKTIPCWSLAALLGVLPDGTDVVKDKSDTENEKYMCTVGIKDDITSTFGNNPVDACVAMILKLHELNLL